MKCCRQEYIKKVELDLQNFGEFSTEIRIRISNLEVKRLEDICTEYAFSNVWYHRAFLKLHKNFLKNLPIDVCDRPKNAIDLESPLNDQKNVARLQKQNRPLLSR